MPQVSRKVWAILCMLCTFNYNIAGLKVLSALGMPNFLTISHLCSKIIVQWQPDRLASLLFLFLFYSPFSSSICAKLE